MFSAFKKTITSLYTTLTSPLQKLFTRPIVDVATVAELEKILIESDMGIATTKAIIAKVQEAVRQRGTAITGSDIKPIVHAELCKILKEKAYTEPTSDKKVYLLVGINGSGKTTVASKLAQRYTAQHKRVLLVAADTYRAAAKEQLTVWAERAGASIILGEPQQDPSAVIFAGCKKFINEGFDILIIDTAGRLQTKINLMHELEKMRKVISKQLPHQTITTLLTVDSMLGQNSFEQAKLFHASTPLDGIVLTKLDGTGRGGIIFSITNTLHIPIAYISYGETMDAFAPFDAQAFVDGIIAPE
jgi:fused signal recognition particle receptor